MEPGTRKQVQSAHRGYKSRLWKYVYIDGVEQSKEILHTDTYNASKAIVKVGPAAPAVTVPLPEETTAPVETQPAESSPVEGENGGPGVTLPEAAAPEPAPAPEPEAPAVSPVPAPEAAGAAPAV